MLRLRPMLRRSAVVPCVLALGGVAYFLWVKPFERERIEDSFMTLGRRPGGEIRTLLDRAAQDPLAAPIGARLLVCRLSWSVVRPKWTWDEQSQHEIMRLLVAGRCDAAVPKFAEPVDWWNRRPRSQMPDAVHFATRALQALGNLGTPAADQTLARLARDYPPFPRPYSASLPAYAKRGWQAEVLAWAKPVIAALEKTPEENRSVADRELLAEIRWGLKTIPGPEVPAPLSAPPSSPQTRF